MSKPNQAPSAPAIRPIYLTLVQAAAVCSCPVETVRYWVHVNKLHGYKPGRSLLIRADELDALISSRELNTIRAERARAGKRVRAVAP